MCGERKATYGYAVMTLQRDFVVMVDIFVDVMLPGQSLNKWAQYACCFASYAYCQTFIAGVATTRLAEGSGAACPLQKVLLQIDKRYKKNSGMHFRTNKNLVSYVIPFSSICKSL
jgi:hypothetical protein